MKPAARRCGPQSSHAGPVGGSPFKQKDLIISAFNELKLGEFSLTWVTVRFALYQQNCKFVLPTTNLKQSTVHLIVKSHFFCLVNEISPNHLNQVSRNSLGSETVVESKGRTEGWYGDA